ncbi:MAG TPA: NUDIX hydrolase [Anaerolineales bacterium]|nr:NUDIX hydrolase [Anaerolineales bacterium]
MQTKGSSCVVVNERDEVLLVLREDFRIWALPGGGIEQDETWEQAAVRETLEETGYQVEIKQYIGEYWRPQMSHGRGDLRHVFLAQAIDGTPAPHDKESIDVRWFPANALPARMFRFSREHIYDALARPATPLKKEQRLPAWMDAGIRIAYLIRNLFDKILSIKNNRQEKG